MRIVWLKHVWWTREVILAIANNAPWTNQSVEKLLQNPAEMAAVFAPFISPVAQKQMIELFKTHLSLGGDIVTAAKNGQTDRVAELQKQWHKNADQIAQLMASLGLGFNEKEVRKMLYHHLELTTSEALQVLNGQYKQAIATFDEIQNQALMMADYFSCTIINTILR